MARSRIISTAPIDQIAIDILGQVAEVEIAASPDEKTVLDMVDGAVGIVCRGEGRVTARLIEAAPALRVIGRPGAGFDAVDVAKATARGIPVIYAPVGSFAVAEGALALLLALVKKVVLCDTLVKSGQWNKRYEISTRDMTGCTLGIIGLGRIGSHLARLVQPFEMTVLGYDPIVNEVQLRIEGVKPVSLEELLARSDFISVHVPLNEETQGLINRRTVALMKPGAMLINTARGGVVESLDVLAEALESGRLGAVALDVFPAEPPDTSHPIFRHPNFVCAPHLAGVSEIAMDRIYRSMASDMVAVLEGRQPKYCVNPAVLR
jgi:D-3-phosphoglycerate dehydrogenase / 2-oxoglutarate reductase